MRSWSQTRLQLRQLHHFLTPWTVRRSACFSPMPISGFGVNRKTVFVLVRIIFLKLRNVQVMKHEADVVCIRLDENFVHEFSQP